jgi:hypothetical protein
MTISPLRTSERVGYQAFDGTHDRGQFCRALFQNMDQFFGSLFLNTF